MADRASRATLSKGRSGWCVIFRHPVARTPDGSDKLRVRRGLGTRDEAEASILVDQLNQILADSDWWSPTTRERAELQFSPQVVKAFYDYLVPEQSDAWASRDNVIPLPGPTQGYARLLMIGTTGAGKTTIVRQLLDTDPTSERFPSTSAAKTTICDIEIIMRPGNFEAVVAFMPKDQVRQYISDCVAAAATRLIQNPDQKEVTRRFLEHTDQQFRLSYVLGSPARPAAADDDVDDEEVEELFASDEDELLVSDEQREEFAACIRGHLDAIRDLGTKIAGEVEAELGTKIAELPAKDMDAFEELVELALLRHEDFYCIVDAILEDVEERFDYVSCGEFERGREGWPRLWHFTESDRKQFIREVNRFTSNYAPNFGRLLTPLVEGIRVAGSFAPAWRDEPQPRLVIMDGRGIGHTADSGSSVSTSITRRYELSDAILLVDNAAQPMQAAPCAVLRSLTASGHESKLIICFTHFDEVKGDNLLATDDRRSHVLSSVDNAIHAVGKALGRDAEHSLRRLLPERAVFLAGIHKRICTGARFTRNELIRMLTMIEDSITPPAPVEYKPVYDVANLVLAIQSATQEFHDAWHGVLGMQSRSGVPAEHWTRVKALTRHVGLLHRDEYDTLRPIADLIRVLQDSISRYLAEPFKWIPEQPPKEAADKRVQVIDGIKKLVYNRLHDLSTRRLLAEQLSGWREAYEHRGYGSTRVRARDLLALYESAAPIPNEMPARDANEFLFEIREIVAESILSGGGDIKGWTRQEAWTEA